jgi:hypothetical protein
LSESHRKSTLKELNKLARKRRSVPQEQKRIEDIEKEIAELAKPALRNSPNAENERVKFSNTISQLTATY